MMPRKTRFLLCAAMAIVFITLLALVQAIDARSLAQNGSPTDYLQQIEQGLSLLSSLLALDIALTALLALFIYKTGNNSHSHHFKNQTLHPVSQTDTSGYRYWFAAILCLSVVLRVINLNSGMWIDEYLTVQNYIQPSLPHISTNFLDDNQHWLFSVLAKCATLLLGEHPWVIRLPALIFGVLSVWATYRLGKLVFNPQSALLAATVLTISYHHIWYSQNARGYTILLFATVISVELLIRALQSNRWSFWLFYAASLALAVGGHLTGIFVGVAHFIVVVVYALKNYRSPSDLTKPLVAFVVAALLTLHMFAVIIPQMASFFLASGSEIAPVHLQWKNPLWTVSELATGVGVPESYVWPVVCALLIIGVVTAVFFYRRNPVFLFAAVLPGVLLIVTMILMGRNLWPRLLFNMAGFIALYSAYIAVSTSHLICTTGNGRLKRIRLAPQIILLGLFLSATFSVYDGPKQDFQSAHEFIESNKVPGDTIVGLHISGVIAQHHYNPEWQHVTTIDDLQLAGAGGNTWVVYTLPGYIKNARPDIYAELQTNYQTKARFSGTLGDGDIIIMKNNRQAQ